MFLIIWRANPCASKGKIIPGDIFKQNAWLWQLIISRALPSRHNLNFELTTKSIGGGVPGFSECLNYAKIMICVSQETPHKSGFWNKRRLLFFFFSDHRGERAWPFVLCVPAVEPFDVTQGRGKVWLTCRTTPFATQGSVLAAPPSPRTADSHQSFTSAPPRDSLTRSGQPDRLTAGEMERFLKMYANN